MAMTTKGSDSEEMSAPSVLAALSASDSRPSLREKQRSAQHAHARAKAPRERAHFSAVDSSFSSSTLLSVMPAFSAWLRRPAFSTKLSSFFSSILRRTRLRSMAPKICVPQTPARRAGGLEERAAAAGRGRARRALAACAARRRLQLRPPTHFFRKLPSFCSLFSTKMPEPKNSFVQPSCTVFTCGVARAQRAESSPQAAAQRGASRPGSGAGASARLGKPRTGSACRSCALGGRLTRAQGLRRRALPQSFASPYLQGQRTRASSAAGTAASGGASEPHLDEAAGASSHGGAASSAASRAGHDGLARDGGREGQSGRHFRDLRGARVSSRPAAQCRRNAPVQRRRR